MSTKSTVAMFLLGLGLFAFCKIAVAQDITIIVNKQTFVSHITTSQLREIFTGARSRFGDGGRAVPVLLKGGPVHEVFLSHYLGDSPEEFRVRWRKAVFTGQGAMPREFASEAAMLEYISATPGAIGYVSRVADPDAVRTLTVSAQP